MDAELIDKRVVIRQRLEAGDVESAIETIREADESLLEKDAELSFALHKQ